MSTQTTNQSPSHNSLCETADVETIATIRVIQVAEYVLEQNGLYQPSRWINRDDNARHYALNRIVSQHRADTDLEVRVHEFLIDTPSDTSIRSYTNSQLFRFLFSNPISISDQDREKIVVASIFLCLYF